MRPDITITKEKYPIALVIQDTHFTLQKPPARNDKDWKKTQQRYVNEVMKFRYDLMSEMEKKLQNKFTWTYENWTMNIFITGDVFNKYDESSECTSFFMNQLFNMVGDIYTIPGQHDLPYHNYDDMHKSAYGLVTNGNVCDLKKGTTTYLFGSDYEDGPSLPIVHPFPYGCDIDSKLKEYKKCEKEEDDEEHENYSSFGKKHKTIKIALVHAYCGMTGKTFDPNNTKLDNAEAFRKKFKGYDIVCFGDNHKHFVYKKEKNGKVQKPIIYNGGAFIPRNSDEKGNRSYIGVIYSNGDIQAVPMESNKKDKWKKNLKKTDKKDKGSLVEVIEKAQNLSIKTKEAFLGLVTELVNSKKCTPLVAKIIKDIVKQTEDE